MRHRSACLSLSPRRVLVLAAQLLPLCFAFGCVTSGMTKPPESPLQPPRAPESALILRGAFDDDPSEYIGRFLPDALAHHEVDENRASQTRCSEFVTHKVKKGTATFDQYFQASSSAKAALGFPPIAGISASASEGVAVRVKYEQTKKMMSVLTDPVAYERCCKSGQGLCAKRHLGEYIFGSGVIYQWAGAQRNLDASGVAKQVNGALEMKDQYAWKRMSKFTDVYFAFRPVRGGNVGTGETEKPCAWAYGDKPRSPDGTYFVGISKPMETPQEAYQNAMMDARRQVVRYLGEQITSSLAQTSGELEGALKDHDVVTATAKGLAKYVTDEKRCPEEKTKTIEGYRYTARLLAFIPNPKTEAASRDALKLLSDALRAAGKVKEADAVMKLHDSKK